MFTLTKPNICDGYGGKGICFRMREDRMIPHPVVKTLSLSLYSLRERGKHFLTSTFPLLSGLLKAATCRIYFRIDAVSSIFVCLLFFSKRYTIQNMSNITSDYLDLPFLVPSSLPFLNGLCDISVLPAYLECFLFSLGSCQNTGGFSNCRFYFQPKSRKE